MEAMSEGDAGFPTTAEFVIQHANDQFLQGSYKVALRYYEACVIATNGTDPKLWLAMAHCHCALNNVDIALDMAKYAYSMDRGFVDSLLLVVVLLANTGKWGELAPLLNTLKLLDRDEPVPYLIGTHTAYLNSIPYMVESNIRKLEELLPHVSKNERSQWSKDAVKYMTLVMDHFKLGDDKMSNREINDTISSISDKRVLSAIPTLKGAMEFEQLVNLVKEQVEIEDVQVYSAVSQFRKEYPTEEDVSLLYAVFLSRGSFKPEVHRLLVASSLCKSLNLRPLTIPALGYLSVGTEEDFRTSSHASHTLLAIIAKTTELILKVGKNNNTMNSKLCSSLWGLCVNERGCLLAAGILISSPVRVMGEGNVSVLDASSFITRLIAVPEMIEDESIFERGFVSLCVIANAYLFTALHNFASARHTLAKILPLFYRFVESPASRADHAKAGLDAYSLALIIDHIAVILSQNRLDGAGSNGGIQGVSKLPEVVSLATKVTRSAQLFPDVFDLTFFRSLMISERQIRTAKQFSSLCIQEGYVRIGYSLLRTLEKRKPSRLGHSQIATELYKAGAYPKEYFGYLLANDKEGKSTDSRTKIIVMQLTHSLSSIALKALNKNLASYHAAVSNTKRNINLPLIPTLGAIGKLNVSVIFSMASLKHMSHYSQSKGDSSEEDKRHSKKKYLEYRKEVESTAQGVYRYIKDALRSSGGGVEGTTNSINTYSLVLDGLVVACVLANDKKYMSFAKDVVTPDCYPCAILNLLRTAASNDNRLLAQVYFLSGCVCLGNGGAGLSLRSQERSKMAGDALEYFTKAAKAGILTLSNDSHYVNSIINKHEFYLLPPDPIPMSLQLYAATAAFDRAITLHNFDMLLYLRTLRSLMRLCSEYPAHGMFAYDYAYSVKVLLRKVGKNLDTCEAKMRQVMEGPKKGVVTELRQIKRVVLDEIPIDLLDEFELHIQNALSCLQSHVLLCESNPSLYVTKQLTHDSVDTIDTAPFFSAIFLSAFGVSRMTEGIVSTLACGLDLAKAKNVLRLSLQVSDGVQQIQSFKYTLEQLDFEIQKVIGTSGLKTSKPKDIESRLRKMKQQQEVEALKRGEEARLEMQEMFRQSQLEQELKSKKKERVRKGRGSQDNGDGFGHDDFENDGEDSNGNKSPGLSSELETSDNSIVG